jgi:hypothetical protein
MWIKNHGAGAGVVHNHSMSRGVGAALIAISAMAIVGPACSGGGQRKPSMDAVVGCPLPLVRASGQLVSCCGGSACNGVCAGAQCSCPRDVPGGCPDGSVCCEDGCHPYVAGFACPSAGGADGGAAGSGGSGGVGGAGGAPLDGGGDCSPSSQFINEVSCCNGTPCEGECHDGQCVCNLGGGNFSAGCTDGLVCCGGHGCELHTQDTCFFGPP